MKSKKQMKAEMLTETQDQLKDRDEIAKIIKEELMQQLEGGTFWSELKEIVQQNKPTPAAKAAKVTPQEGVLDVKKVVKRRLNPKMKERGELVKKIMREHPPNLAQASKYIKDNALI
jgi:predicted nucleic acid-binding Zn ribbon protein